MSPVPTSTAGDPACACSTGASPRAPLAQTPTAWSRQPPRWSSSSHADRCLLSPSSLSFPPAYGDTLKFLGQGLIFSPREE